MHLRGARAMGLPTSLPPVLLVGEPGLGKSWFLSRLSACLGLPYRRYSMSSSTLAEGLQGAHPCWRNAQPGMVAKTLLAEQVANPVIFVDEVDKVGSHAQNISPHRAFYALLDQSDSTGFIDDYLGFPIDASKITWVMAANDADALPPAILDRLEILHVPEPSAEQRANIDAGHGEVVAFARHGPSAPSRPPLSSQALAEPPFITDDPVPVDLGHWEVYGFSAGAIGRHDASGLGPSIEVNYGAAPNLQLHVIPGLAYDDPFSGGTRMGFSDTEIGAKYRLLTPSDTSRRQSRTGD
jgi:hypothetical protein